MPVSVPAQTFTGTAGRLYDPMTLPALGLGCMGMSDAYGPADRDESIATVHAALDAGIFLLDTGDFYGQGHNELLIREALWSRRREDVFIAVKFGALRDPEGRFLGFDSRPAAVKNALAYTLKRLGTDYVDLYQPARLDPVGPQHRRALIGHGCVGCPGGHHEDPFLPGLRPTPHHGAAEHRARPVDGQRSLRLGLLGP